MTIDLVDIPCDCIPSAIWPGYTTVGTNFGGPSNYLVHPGGFSTVNIAFDNIISDNLDRSGAPSASLPDGIVVPYTGLYLIFGEARFHILGSTPGDVYKTQFNVVTAGQKEGRDTNDLTEFFGGAGPFRAMSVSYFSYLPVGTLVNASVFVDGPTDPPLRIYSCGIHANLITICS